MIFHFTNVYMNEAGDVVFDQPTWRGCNGYENFKMSHFLSRQNRDAFREKCENVLRRFTLHRSGTDAGKVSTEVLNTGWFEFPQFNHMWRGRASCFIYLTEWYHEGGENADMALVKFDTCKKKRIEWHHRGHFPGEPNFVPRPAAVEEDDGVIVSVVLDGASQESYLLILDAKGMSPIERFAIGRRIPMVVHGEWKFDMNPGIATSEEASADKLEVETSTEEAEEAAMAIQSQVLHFLVETQRESLSRELVSLNAAISMCEEIGQWNQALLLLDEMHKDSACAGCRHQEVQVKPQSFSPNLDIDFS